MIKAKIITNNKIKKFLSSNEIIKLDNFYFQQNVKTLFSCNSFTSLPNFSAFLFSSLLQMFRHFLLFILSFLGFSFLRCCCSLRCCIEGESEPKTKKCSTQTRKHFFYLLFLISSLFPLILFYTSHWALFIYWGFFYN